MNEGKEAITGGSAFNIKAESLRLGNFGREEIAALYGEHTRETGQPFAPEAVERVWDLTRGQPWLVNALAYEACFRIREARDRSVPVTGELIELLLATARFGTNIPDDDDLQYVIDHGLVTRGAGGLEVANPIYQELISSQLT